MVSEKHGDNHLDLSVGIAELLWFRLIFDFCNHSKHVPREQTGLESQQVGQQRRGWCAREARRAETGGRFSSVRVVEFANESEELSIDT